MERLRIWLCGLRSGHFFKSLREFFFFAFLTTLEEGFEGFNVSKTVVLCDLTAVLVHAKKCINPKLSPGSYLSTKIVNVFFEKVYLRTYFF